MYFGLKVRLSKNTRTDSPVHGMLSCATQKCDSGSRPGEGRYLLLFQRWLCQTERLAGAERNGSETARTREHLAQSAFVHRGILTETNICVGRKRTISKSIHPHPRHYHRLHRRHSRRHIKMQRKSFARRTPYAARSVGSYSIIASVRTLISPSLLYTTPLRKQIRGISVQFHLPIYITVPPSTERH